MANKVRFNIKNVHYAKKTTEGYGTPIAIPGAVSLTCDPQGEESIFWADGIKYYVSRANNGYEGDLEVALLPDSFAQDILGDTLDTNNVLVENANAPTVEFALGFEVEGDTESVLFWYYNCTASRPSVEANTTEETKEPETESLDWSCSPDTNGVVRVKTTATTGTSIRTAWFTTVYTTPATAQGNNG